MKAKKLSTAELLRRVDAGQPFTEIAKECGVSRQAVQKRVRALRGKTTRAVVSGKIAQVVDRKLDSAEQLTKINLYANELLDLCMAWGRGDEVALQVLESQRTTRTVRIGDEEISADEFRFKDPRELALKAMAEIRSQLKLQMEIFQAIYDLRAAQEFQEEVLQIIGEVAPDVRKQIIERLNQRRSIREIVRFS